MKTAIIATGSELISGLVQDSNSKFLAENLSNLGFQIKKIYICGDEKEDIKKTVLNAAENADLIFITGGLGPTKDDQTKEAFAEALNLKLNYSKELENKLKNIFCNHNSKMTTNNLTQAYLPVGAEVIKNEKGTAPALKIENKDKLFFLLPGVPSELKYLFNNKIYFDLKKLTKDKVIIKEFNFIGIGESTLASKVEDLELNSALKVSYQAGRAEVKLRLKIDKNTQFKTDKKNKIIKEAAKKIKNEFNELIYGEDQESIISKTHKQLISKKISISTAESFTGGLIAERLTEKEGSSQFFLGSIIAYNKKIKKELLNIKNSLFNKYGVVSKQCAEAMAKNAAEIFNTEIAVATTGAAGPGSHNGKSAGTMFVAIFFQSQVKTFKLKKDYGREMNRYYASQIALFEIYKLLKESEEN